MTPFDKVRLACAVAAHEVNRAYCRALGDDSQAAWDSAEPWQRDSALHGVDGVFDGNDPATSHATWLAYKEADGWTYGPTKDSTAKTHPCMLPYEQLPPEQKEKDHLFVQTVRSVAAALGYVLDETLVRDRLHIDIRSRE